MDKDEEQNANLHNELTEKDRIINELQKKLFKQSQEVEELILELNVTKRKS